MVVHVQGRPALGSVYIAELVRKGAHVVCVWERGMHLASD